MDNVNKFAVDNMTTNIALDFESENLFRTCSVAINLVTSIEFNPIRCATMLCHIRQTWNGSVPIYFLRRGSAATSNATGDYVAVPERLGQNEEPASSNEERTEKNPSFVPKWI